MRIKIPKTIQRPTKGKRQATQVKLSADELTALGRFLAAGQVLLQADYPPVVARLKAAMTRLGVAVPKGL